MPPQTGFRVILEGVPGSGKTDVLNSLPEECDLETFVVFLEKGMHVIRESDKMHWAYIPTMAQSWESMRVNAKRIQNLQRKDLYDVVPDTQSFPQFFDLLDLLNNFKDHNGKEYGDVCDWGPDKVLVLDGLTGLSDIAMSLVLGDKPVRSVSDYGIAMGNLYTFLKKCTTSLNCHFVLLSHLEREKDEISGAVLNKVSTLGQQLAPVIPNDFPDTVLCQRRGTEFSWSTLNDSYILKHFYLPLSDEIPPTFKTIYDKWKEGS